MPILANSRVLPGVHLLPCHLSKIGIVRHTLPVILLFRGGQADSFLGLHKILNFFWYKARTPADSQEIRMPLARIVDSIRPGWSDTTTSILLRYGNHNPFSVYEF